MNKDSLTRGVVFAVLVGSGALSRIYFREVPNFAPIAALALFAGFYFRSAWLAALVPMLAMVSSDWVIGGYDWRQMAVVYGALTMPVLLRGFLRKHLALKKEHWSGMTAPLVGLLACSLTSSVFFFLATNFACWPGSEVYEQNLAGLWNCYLQGLPFFRHTLLGDLCFASVLFGGYAIAIQLGWTAETQAKVVSLKA